MTPNEQSESQGVRHRTPGGPPAQQTLMKGVEILTDAMRSHGFVYVPGATGKGSGGSFATGEFRRGNRRLELHYRYSLGLVSYHVGRVTLSHEDYMWSAQGQRWRSHYPGFGMTGSEADFAAHANWVAALKNTARLP